MATKTVPVNITVLDDGDDRLLTYNGEYFCERCAEQEQAEVVAEIGPRLAARIAERFKPATPEGLVECVSCGREFFPLSARDVEWGELFHEIYMRGHNDGHKDGWQAGERVGRLSGALAAMLGVPTTEATK